MMTAFEDYVDKAIAGNIGVPINYYLKNITRAQLAEMWMAKYFSNKYLMISGDDSGSSANGTAAAQTKGSGSGSTGTPAAHDDDNGSGSTDTAAAPANGSESGG